MDIYIYIKNSKNPYHSFDDDGSCRYCDKLEEECDSLICAEKYINPLSTKTGDGKTSEIMDLYGWRSLWEEQRQKINNEIIEALNSARLEHKNDKEKDCLYLFIFKMAKIPFGKVLHIRKVETFDDDEIPIKYEGKKVLVKRHHLLKLFTEQENVF